MQADEVSVMAKVTPQKESGWRKQHQQKADSAQASRRWLATQLAALVAFSGMIPIAVVGVISLRTLRVRAIADAQGTLQAVAQQAAERIRTYEIQQREMLHAIAANMGTDAQAEQRLEEITLDARSFKVLRLLDNKSHHDKFFQHIPATLLMQAFAGAEISSEIYAAADSTPAIDSCVPVRARPGHTVCASLDLFELQRLVQRIHVGESGEAVALNPEGHVIAAGAGGLRAAALTGELVAESTFATQLARANVAPPKQFTNGLGKEVLGGWALLPGQNWIVVVEQPLSEALAPTNEATIWLTCTFLIALVVSLTLGYRYSQRVLASLEVEERWRTAGRIAAGISHDLGHRLAILKQTASLAETGEAVYLPVIRDNLKSEISTLRRFVTDFADLSRAVKRTEFVTLELNAFAESVRKSAQPYADQLGVTLNAEVPAESPWVRADRYLLERATLNLLTNALEASPNASTVTLRVRVDLKQKVAAIEVQDRGPGISPDRVPEIFSAFLSTKRTGAHVGLGLANVHRIVRAHGGIASLRSQLGRGSTFIITLPLATKPD